MQLEGFLRTITKYLNTGWEGQFRNVPHPVTVYKKAVFSLFLPFLVTFKHIFFVDFLGF